MRFISLLFLTLFVCFASRSQKLSQYSYFNSDEFWGTLVMDDSGKAVALKPADTVIVVVSTRAAQNDPIRFMSEVRGDNLNYFVVYARNEQWHLLRRRSLSECLQLVPDKEKDWVVYTEGMGKIFTSDLDRGMRMTEQYKVNIILLDYPSIRTTYGSLKNYRFAKHNAINACRDLLPIFDSIHLARNEHRMGAGHLTLFFHSMGNKVIREAAKKHRLGSINRDRWVDNLILNAPCVSTKGHRKWLNQVQFTRHIYVHYNPEDFTLKWARLLSLHKQLGDRIRKPLSDNAVYINFNPLCGRDHSNFLSLLGRGAAKPEAVAHYSTLFHGDAVNVADTMKYRPSGYRHIGYDILPYP